PDRPERGHVRAPGNGLRVPCLRDARLPEHRHRARRPGGGAARPRRRADRGDRADAREPGAPFGRAAAGGDVGRSASPGPGASGGRPSRVGARARLRALRPRPVPDRPRSPRARRADPPGAPTDRRTATGHRRGPTRRHRLRRRAVGVEAVAPVDRGQPIGLAAATNRLTVDVRSIALLEFPLVRERLADKTSFPPSRRLADALVPDSDPVLVARALDETDRARALRSERPGVGVGAARDIGPAIDRAARGGRLDPAQFLELADTLDATARLQTSLADDRRPLLHALARELHPLPAIRSTLARS